MAAAAARSHDGKFAPKPAVGLTQAGEANASSTTHLDARITRLTTIMDRHDAHRTVLNDLMASMHAAKVTVADLQSKIDSRKLELVRARDEATALLFGP